MAIPSDITLLPFQPEDQQAVKDLILTGLVEHWGVLDPEKNPDLNDIAVTYASATFLIAWYQDEIVGTGGLVPHSDGIAEIVRMSVCQNFRRMHIGSKILTHLVDFARQSGIRQVILETTDTWQEVIAFYLRFGFRITHYHAGDVFFALDLK